ncbi:MAG: RpiB/LacA/LacB family sugar-phosphate isomerase [bacterium]|nr:RpiB/LacA/LacB family sugar-phosphate isomerase [bacterium]
MIVFGADHAGSSLKQVLLGEMQSSDLSVKDCGVPPKTKAADYPDLAIKVVEELKKDQDPYSFGVLVCGSGIGMVIAANRFPHIGAVLCHSVEEAIRARSHNNANVLCLGSEVTSSEESIEILKAFLQTPGPKGERHLRRIEKMNHPPFSSLS